MVTVWHNGDECALIGETERLAGATWEVLVRISDGKRLLRRLPSEKAADVASKRQEWLDQQTAFRNLHKGV